MNRSLMTVVLLGCLFLAGGCGSDQDQSDPVSDASHGSHDANLKLELNDGQKWQVDDHTRQSAANLVRLIEETPPIATTDDGAALAAALDEELSALVSGCTMTGAAHDQLHVFLTALFPKVAELKSQTEVKGSQGVREEIGSILAAYQAHFN